MCYFPYQDKKMAISRDFFKTWFLILGKIQDGYHRGDMNFRVRPKVKWDRIKYLFPTTATWIKFFAKTSNSVL